ncbi:sigma-70 family RNA polymerase sigma factor [Staphylococcus lutrae]|uniref:RNA polymerase subunit sigma-70 n=1 Tax=Staphylococcus lutrae TaxID=155085 RepID=A0AAC9RSN4_9STAP|nr:sigma-70 family RNA polymerase sigma factor [Staphylococcus lutrae]ARJ50060.1 RNA polymerase subunit sigma-70 [Staphylococcus lutrae]PNZ38368.1 sigma-70 family RNA polymerase sigma factor [Staphylococcus lutrae]
MIFDTLYKQYYKLIHYLLHQHHISYNYEEYFQLLTIKLWELSMKYQPTFNQSFSTFVSYRLKFYLIDLLRQQSSQVPLVPMTSEIYEISDHTPVINHFILNDLILELSPAQQTWLHYFMEGYLQKEIQQRMCVSATTIRKYKSTTLLYLRQALTDENVQEGMNR